MESAPGWDIIQPDASHLSSLSELAESTFRTSHGHSAQSRYIEAYCACSFSTQILAQEIINPEHQYFIMERDGQVLAYSKLMLDCPLEEIEQPAIASLDRLYVSEEMQGQGLGRRLLDHNMKYAQAQGQQGLWLHVWVENEGAIAFYKRQGFEVIGNYDFAISPEHSNPNYTMYKVV